MSNIPIRLSEISSIEKVSKGKLDLMNQDIDILDLIKWDSRSIIELNLGYNNLMDLKGIQQFKNLKYLDLSNNNVRLESSKYNLFQISSISDLKILAQLEKLEFLDLTNNPITQHPLYFEFVVLFNESLSTLDREVIQKSEKEQEELKEILGMNNEISKDKNEQKEENIIAILQDQVYSNFTEKFNLEFQALILEDLEVLMETFPEESFIKVWGRACSDYASRQLNKLNKQNLILSGEQTENIEFTPIEPVSIQGLRVLPINGNLNPNYPKIAITEDEDGDYMPRNNIPEPTESYIEESVSTNNEYYDSLRMNPSFNKTNNSTVLQFSENSPYVKIVNSRSNKIKNQMQTPSRNQKLSHSPHYQNCSSFSPKRTVKKEYVPHIMSRRIEETTKRLEEMKQLLREKVEAIAVVESEYNYIEEEKNRMIEINQEIMDQYQLKDMIIHKISELRRHVDSLNAELQDTSLDFKRLKDIKEQKLTTIEKIESLEDKINIYQHKEQMYQEKIGNLNNRIKQNIFNTHQNLELEDQQEELQNIRNTNFSVINSKYDLYIHMKNKKILSQIFSVWKQISDVNLSYRKNEELEIINKYEELQKTEFLKEKRELEFSQNTQNLLKRIEQSKLDRSKESIHDQSTFSIRRRICRRLNYFNFQFTKWQNNRLFQSLCQIQTFIVSQRLSNPSEKYLNTSTVRNSFIPEGKSGLIYQGSQIDFYSGNVRYFESLTGQRYSNFEENIKEDDQDIKQPIKLINTNYITIKLEKNTPINSYMKIKQLKRIFNCLFVHTQLSKNRKLQIQRIRKRRIKNNLQNSFCQILSYYTKDKLLEKKIQQFQKMKVQNIFLRWKNDCKYSLKIKQKEIFIQNQIKKVKLNLVFQNLIAGCEIIKLQKLSIRKVLKTRQKLKDKHRFNQFLHSGKIFDFYQKKLKQSRIHTKSLCFNALKQHYQTKVKLNRISNSIKKLFDVKYSQNVNICFESISCFSKTILNKMIRIEELNHRIHNQKKLKIMRMLKLNHIRVINEKQSSIKTKLSIKQEQNQHIFRLKEEKINKIKDLDTLLEQKSEKIEEILDDLNSKNIENNEQNNQITINFRNIESMVTQKQKLELETNNQKLQLKNNLQTLSSDILNFQKLKEDLINKRKLLKDVQKCNNILIVILTKVEKKLRRIEKESQSKNLQKGQSHMEEHELSLIDELRKQFYALNVEKSKKIDKIRALESRLRDMESQIKIEMVKCNENKSKFLVNTLQHEKNYLKDRDQKVTKDFKEIHALNEQMKITNSSGLYEPIFSNESTIQSIPILPRYISKSPKQVRFGTDQTPLRVEPTKGINKNTKNIEGFFKR